ncbi:MAG: aldolase/citrate lyase family protein [Elusimicrobiota bacterium]
MPVKPTLTQSASTKTWIAADGLPVGYPDFLRALVTEFEPRRHGILERRRQVLSAWHMGHPTGYLPESAATRGDWKLTLPSWAQDQRNQITGPADKVKYLLGMCNSSDPGCMPDGEDSISTDWVNVRAAQQNTVSAIKGSLSYTDTETKQVKTLKANDQVIYYRPRGLLLEETHALQGQAISASIFDISMIFYQTVAERKSAALEPAKQRRLCFYIPKNESAEEAAWWSDLIARMETLCGIPVGTTKIMYLIESLPAAYQVEEIIDAARRHVIGLNLGRWDYMASLLHFKFKDPDWILPDRNTIPHDIAFFQNLRVRLVDACHRRGILAIGGMTALFPDRKDHEVNACAALCLAADKKNEAILGFDGAWTGHPDQHEGAISQFPAPNQLHVTHPQAPKHLDLVPSPTGIGRVSLAGTQDAVRTVIEYRYGVLAGLGARLIKGYDHKGALIGGFMEDLATDRIYRTMLAQRLYHATMTQEGTKITLSALSKVFDAELAKILKEHDKDADAATVKERYVQARMSAEKMTDPQGFLQS